MNIPCYERLINDNSISMFCKSWIWIYSKVFNSERWRRWHGHYRYPFYEPEFIHIFQSPLPVNQSEQSRLDFYSCCEHWYDCCIGGNSYEIQKDLPFSGGGLGLVSLHDTSYQDLYDDVFGVLEFVDDDLFSFLQNNNYPSLYKTKEGDLCVLFGPLSLCNNGRTENALNFYPSFKDRHMLTDEELVYESMRKRFVDNNEFPPRNFIYILFDHYSLRMHITNNIPIAAGVQIMVDYGFVT
jgi:hypothetical protein